jgi:hypothetical protein
MDLQLRLLEDFLHFIGVGFIEVHLGFVLVLPRLQLGLGAVFQCLFVGHFASRKVHLLNDVLLEHQRVNLALEIVVSFVRRTLQHFDS